MKIVLHILLLFACGLLKYAVAKSIKQQNDDKRAFSFDDVIPNRFGQRGFGGSWISGTEFTYVANGNFVKHNVENNTNVTILTREFLEIKGWQGASLRMSPDNTKVLVRYSNRQIFRHSAVAKYSIWFLQAPNSEFKVANGEEIQICFFAPDGKRLVHIKNNNIYSTVIGDNMPELPEIITGDGIDGTIYNGIPDWVYEEEVLGGDAASWISADGQHLAFVKFDDTNVTNAVYELYGEGDQQYPEHVQLRYPKPGTNNPTVSLNLYNFASRKRSVLEIPAKVTGEHILGTVFWIDDQTLGAIWLNRRQNFGLFVAYDVNTEQMTELLEMNQPYGWIDLSTPKCLDSICYFIDDYNNWPTLTGVNTKDKQDIKRLTSTGMNVLNFYGINNGIYYYASTPSADESFKRHTYFNDGCLTCDFKTPEGNTCSYASTTFSKDFSYYIMTCSGPDPSFTKIFKTDGNVEIYSWEENNDLREKLKGQIMPQTKIFHVPVGGNFKAVVRMILPPQIDFDGTSTKDKYPMLVRVYGGPGSVRILDTFSIGYHTYQITSKNYIYVEIDGRGTGNKGNDMMFSINNRLGSYEMDDQISVAKYLIDKYAFVDASKTAIWGWSYGGYATAMTLAKDVDMVYKCGASVAPVTSWRFYDSIYTERYMGVSANASNYFESDVATLKHVQQIGKHQFLLAHGNSDDNVHYQQSMVLARELEMNDILFEQMSYPDEAHGLSGVQRHLYHSLDRFWDNCFKN